MRKFTYEGAAGRCKIVLHKVGGAIVAIFVTFFTGGLLTMMATKGVLFLCGVAFLAWTFILGWLIALLSFNLYPTIWVGDKGLAISFLHRRIFIPWDEVLDVRTAFPSFLGYLVRAKRITPFHRLYGWLYGQSSFPSFLIGQGIQNEDELLREIRRRARGRNQFQVAPPEPTRTRPSRPTHVFLPLWSQWLLGNALAWGVGAVLNGAVIGPLIGVVQWLILRQRVAWARWWVPVSILGWFTGMMLAPTVPSGLNVALSLMQKETRMAYTLLAWLVFGLAIGTAQWYILRWQVHRAGRWILANMIGWTIGLNVVEYGKEGLGIVLSSVVAGVIFGVITGISLAWLLRSPVSNSRGFDV